MVEASQPTACANCNVPIGALEPRLEWTGHPVCAQCYARLATPVGAPIQHVAQAIQPGSVICPLCYANVWPERLRRFDGMTALILFLLAVVPGIIYMVMTARDRIVCPRCKAQIGLV